MATRSTITLKKDDGKFVSTYCHWDGYPTHVGKILMAHYTDPMKIDFLIGLGTLSSLKKEVGPDVGQLHRFERPCDDVTIAYHRDRGDALVVGEGDTYEAAVEDGPSGEFEKYNYLFQDGSWYVRSNAFGDATTLHELATVLASENPDLDLSIPTDTTEVY